MKSIIAVASMVIITGAVLSCTAKQESSDYFNQKHPAAIAPSQDNYNDAFSENFTSSFEITEENSIVAIIAPGEGAYYVSPASNNTFTGLLKVELDSNNFIHMGDTYVESPNSIGAYDSYARENVNKVYERTSYTYGTCLKREKDFEVGGMMSFVIEPECSRYEVRFILKNKDRKLSIIKTTTLKHKLSN
jgi:hypothetical protein